MKQLTLFLVLLFVFAAATMISAAEDAAAGSQTAAAAAGSGAAVAAKRKRSIFQACRKDIEKLCVDSKKGDERRASLRNAAVCLEEKENDVQDETCKAWLSARKVCFADAEKEGVCPGVGENDKEKKVGKEAFQKRGRVMMCLRSVDSEKLSEDCTKSDFYKAIVGLRRFHKKSKGKSGEKSGDGKKEKENLAKLAKKMSE